MRSRSSLMTGLFGLGMSLSVLAAPDLPRTPQLDQVMGWRADLLTQGWEADKTVKVDAQGERGAFGKLGCLVGSEPRTEIQVEGGAASRHGVLSYRGPSEKCEPKGVGVIQYADGSRWLGQIGNVGGIAVPNGIGELTHPDGVRNVLEARMQGMDWRMVRGFVAYHPDQDWYVQAEFEPGWRAREGVYRWSDGREFRGPLVDAAPLGRGRFTGPGGGLVDGEVVRDGDALRWRGTLTVTLPPGTGFGPAGTYLIEPAPGTELGAPIAPQRWAPTASTLAAGVDNDRGCPIPPEMPTGWMPWWPACGQDAATGEILIPVYSPDLTFMLTYVVKDGALARSVLDQLGDLRVTLAPVARWEALMFRSTRQGFQSLGDIRMFDAAGNFLYQGTFSGLDPDGEGYCGRPAAEGGGVEPCLWRSGQRVDAAHQARQARIAQEAQQKQYEAQLAAQRVAQEKAAAEAAARATQAVTTPQPEQKKGGWFNKLGGNLLGVVTGRKSVGESARDAVVTSAVQAAVTPSSSSVPPPGLPPAAGSGGFSSLAAAVAAQDPARSTLASLQSRTLEHTCPSGYRFSVQVPYRTESCLNTKLEYTKAQVCGESLRLASLTAACQAACGNPNCAE
jgi:hypothetical protein